MEKKEFYKIDLYPSEIGTKYLMMITETTKIFVTFAEFADRGNAEKAISLITDVLSFQGKGFSVEVQKATNFLTFSRPLAQN